MVDGADGTFHGAPSRKGPAISTVDLSITPHCCKCNFHKSGSSWLKKIWWLGHNPSRQPAALDWREEKCKS